MLFLPTQAGIMAVEKLRIDKYLWAIRLFKTRSQAADACDKGKVKYQGQSCKASKTVSINDEYEVKTEARKWVIKVTGLLEKRVQYSEAILNYSDITPAEELDRIKFEASAFHTGKRLSKVGRPTKKQKRDLDSFMGDD
jgi:ribosome-associated heat shock protein Hsp15